MPLRFHIRASNTLFFAVIVSGLLSGCSDRQIFPVAGQVFQNGEPLKTHSGYVMLKPDTEKGNDTTSEPSGTIDADGNYEIFTDQVSGAPPGWYKVIVTASGATPEPAPGTSSTRPLPKSLVSAKYGQEDSTPISMEVVASPNEDAYDLDVSD